MIRILASPHSHSAVKLGYPVYTDPEMALQDGYFRDDRSGDTLLRWGAVTGDDWDATINNKESVALCRNKLATLLKVHSVFRTPAIYMDAVPDGVKAVVRRTRHSGGSGFTLVTGPTQLEEGHFATKFIPNTKEYRVYFTPRSFLVGERTPFHEGGLADGCTPEDTCRSKWGYKFRMIPPAGLVEKCAKVRAVTGLDLGAIDAVYSESENKYYFLEVNTGPSLDRSKIVEFYHGYLSHVRR